MTRESRLWIYLAWLLLMPLSANAATPMITATLNDSLFLNSDGSVWGVGNVVDRWPGVTSPIRVFDAPNVVSIATSGGTHFALLADGTVQAVGWNSNGLLGNGTTSGGTAQPMPVPGLFDVRAIAASIAHVLVAKQDGTVWSWGKNDSGQLGDGTRNNRYSPGPVVGLSNIVAVAASNTNSLALDTSGIVWSWGINYGGAAGDGTEGISNTSDPNYFKLVPVRVKNLDQVVAIASGSGTNHALRADGTVWSWGDGFDGKNGDGKPSAHQLLPVRVSNLSGVTAISVTNNHSLALRSDGTVWGWGNNNLGQLGTGAVTSSAVPIQVSGLSDIAAVAAGSYHSAAMRRDGSVLSWGMNSNAQLGDGTIANRSSPAPVLGPGGSGDLNLIQPAPANPNQLPRASLALAPNVGAAPLAVTATATDPYDTDGTVVDYLWLTSDNQSASGTGATFTFSAPGTYTISLLVVDDAGGRGFLQQQVSVIPGGSAGSQVQPKVALGASHSLALSSDGRVFGWGDKWFMGIADPALRDQLPETNAVPVTTGLSGVVDIVVGGFASYAVLADGSVLSWGTNEHGELGAGTQTDFSISPLMVAGLPPIRALAASGHVLALTADGRVYAWGYNWAGQLGVGDTANRFQPVLVPTLTNVVAIAVGWDYSLALKSDGTVWAWGNNEYQHLADGTTINRHQPVRVPGLSGVKKIISTQSSWFAFSSSGSVWGVNVPFGWELPGSEQVFGTRLRMPALDGFVSFAGQWNYIFASKPDGTVWTWGYRDSGLLGIEGTADIEVPTRMPVIGEAVGLAFSWSASAVLRSDGTVLTWGNNIGGHLGDGTFAARSSPVMVVNATFDGPLDLNAAVANSVPGSLIPPFFLATYKSGGLNATSLAADLRLTTAIATLASSGRALSAPAGALAAGGYNVYVAAMVPSEQAPRYFQLDSNNNWGALSWPMAAFMQGVALDSQDTLIRLQVLQSADLRAYVGTSVIVGYGTDPDEMLSNSRYRTIFTVTQQ